VIVRWLGRYQDQVQSCHSSQDLKLSVYLNADWFNN
jgi:hypothetical protein